MDDATPADLTTRLHRFGLARDRLRAAMAGMLGLGLTDLDALEQLELNGPLPQRELGSRLLLTSGAVTMLVDRLERLGLARRTPHPSDRRVTQVELMPEAALPELPEMNQYHAELTKAARALSPEARKQVLGLLIRLEEAADIAAGDMRGRTAPRGRGGKRIADRTPPQEGGSDN
jgi:DNA-binding MarR family transcriptional regulator